ncbi:siderophore-interacting protein [Geodermatophilus sp. YIM 151500]|uniref:siderophore-interacting protein n=1 Tax=Geodermatophilus sp. YIM 151500 TaxID=2984531 RepID=UPI0021E48712|nr:siderophore-interacting protein [Geodermatophilus sp. YIM 151500]MCV2491613.1 siderophore-interacting protein [Geodermatophilus sp. YIM 151500]
MTVRTAQVPAYRTFAVEVARVRRLSPSFVRITFTGSDLDEFASAGLDQRIKVLFPLPARGLRDCPTGADWYAEWRALPEGHRNPMRTYTVRAARPLEREVDVDFVLHGATGPASTWAGRAAPGDEAVLVGPNARFAEPTGGVEWRPPADARQLLLAGDETAVPAVCAIAESLPAGTAARVVLEVPTDDDVLDVEVAPDVRLTWLPRRCGATVRPRGVLLTAAVCAAADELGGAAAAAGADDLDPDALLWDVPAGAAPGADCYAWLAGEAGVVAALRRHLLREAGFDRRSVAFMGYWRLGRADAG